MFLFNVRRHVASPKYPPLVHEPRFGRSLFRNFPNSQDRMRQVRVANKSEGDVFCLLLFKL